MDFYSYFYKKAINDGVELIVTSGVIHDKNGRILILVRKDTAFLGGMHELPGGKLDPGENIKQSLYREIKEETNLDVKKVLFYINCFEYLSRNGKKARQFNFAVEVDSIDGVKLTEHSKYYWNDINECRKKSKMSDEIKNTIEEFYINYEFFKNK